MDFPQEKEKMNVHLILHTHNPLHNTSFAFAQRIEFPEPLLAIKLSTYKTEQANLMELYENTANWLQHTYLCSPMCTEERAQFILQMVISISMVF